VVLATSTSSESLALGRSETVVAEASVPVSHDALAECRQKTQSPLSVLCRLSQRSPNRQQLPKSLLARCHLDRNDVRVREKSVMVDGAARLIRIDMITTMIRVSSGPALMVAVETAHDASYLVVR
jgi:poly-beta-hydroxyalkanoate depolymerase